MIRKNPKVVTEVLRKGASVGKQNTKDGILHGRPEWRPLSQVTIDVKGHEHILFDTGVMVDSIMSGAEGKRAWYGTSVSYAPIHELGLLEPNVPQRAFLMPTTQGHELERIKTGMIDIARILYLRETR